MLTISGPSANGGKSDSSDERRNECESLFLFCLNKYQPLFPLEGNMIKQKWWTGSWTLIQIMTFVFKSILNLKLRRMENLKHTQCESHKYQTQDNYFRRCPTC